MKKQTIKSMLKTLTIGSLTLGLSATTAFAHEEALETQWCEGGQITILGQFQLHSNALAKFMQENEVCSNLRSCGQFDDDFEGARFAANGMCSMFTTTARIDGDYGTIRPIFHAPASIKNAFASHHEIYSISQGVEFSCGICELPADTQTEEEAVEHVQVRN